MGKTKASSSKRKVALAPSVLVVTKPEAICPRCGKRYNIEKPIEYCTVCGLKLAEGKDGELEWTEEMQEPLPDFLTNTSDVSEIFAKTIEWYYKKWILPHKRNPTYRIGEV